MTWIFLVEASSQFCHTVSIYTVSHIFSFERCYNMSLIRSILRAIRRPLVLTIRATSTDPSSSATPTGSNPSSTPPRPPFPRLNFDLPETPISNTAWWERASSSRIGKPGSVNSGRTFPVMRGNDFAPQYKRLQIMLARTRIKNELRRKEYYESPSEKRVRLASERHRRRFAHMVSPGGGTRRLESD